MSHISLHVPCVTCHRCLDGESAQNTASSLCVSDWEPVLRETTHTVTHCMMMMKLTENILHRLWTKWDACMQEAWTRDTCRCQWDTHAAVPSWGWAPAARSRRRGEGCCPSPCLHLTAGWADTLRGGTETHSISMTAAKEAPQFPGNHRDHHLWQFVMCDWDRHTHRSEGFERILWRNVCFLWWKFKLLIKSQSRSFVIYKTRKP